MAHQFILSIIIHEIIREDRKQQRWPRSSSQLSRAESSHSQSAVWSPFLLAASPTGPSQSPLQGLHRKVCWSRRLDWKSIMHAKKWPQSGQVAVTGMLCPANHKQFMGSKLHLGAPLEAERFPDCRSLHYDDQPCCQSQNITFPPEDFIHTHEQENPRKWRCHYAKCFRIINNSWDNRTALKWAGYMVCANL